MFFRSVLHVNMKKLSETYFVHLSLQVMHFLQTMESVWNGKRNIYDTKIWEHCPRAVKKKL